MGNGQSVNRGVYNLVSRSARNGKQGPKRFTMIALCLGILFLNANCGKFNAISTTDATSVVTPTSSDVPASPATANSVPDPSATSTATAPLPTATPVIPMVATPLRVMSYNIKGIPCLKDNFIIDTAGVKKCPLVDDVWTRANKERVSNLLINLQTLRAAGSEPDVILLQEAWTVKNDLFNDSYVRAIPGLAGYPYIAWGPSAKVGNGIDDLWNLVNQDKQALKGLVGSGLLILSKYPILGQASIEYGDLCAIDDCNSNKSALFVKIQHPRGFTIDLVNTHLQAGSPYDDIRAQQAVVYTSFAKQHLSADFLILGGDFNSLMQLNPPAMKTIMDGLQTTDAGASCTANPSGCFIMSGTQATHIGGESLDHILYHANPGLAVEVTQGWTPGWTFSGGLLSDHLPFIMDLSLLIPGAR